MATPLKLITPPKPQKVTRTSLDTILVTPETVKTWRKPVFQRPLKINDKVKAVAVDITENQVIPGILTVGIVERRTGEKVQYLLDGQHRREAFLLSEVKEAYVDVKYHYFENEGDMGEEFVNVNSSLVRLRPDDILRGLEASSNGLSLLRKQCPFIGYDMVRRSEKAPVLSMSAALRCWYAAAPEVPSAGGHSTMSLARILTEEDAEQCAAFYALCVNAWGRDQEYARLWGNLNLTICVWLYRRTVLTQYSPKTPKLTRDIFKKCLMGLSTSEQYLDWLVGRQLGERDRSPAYKRVKELFARRLEVETGKKPLLPSPPWSSNSGSGGTRV